MIVTNNAHPFLSLTFCLWLLFIYLFVYLQHAAGVVGITSGFLLGSAAPLQQLLAPLAIEPLQPIVCLSGAVLCFLEAVIRCLAGSAVLYFTKTGVGRLAKPVCVCWWWLRTSCPSLLRRCARFHTLPVVWAFLADVVVNVHPRATRQPVPDFAVAVGQHV